MPPPPPRGPLFSQPAAAVAPEAPGGRLRVSGAGRIRSRSWCRSRRAGGAAPPRTPPGAGARRPGNAPPRRCRCRCRSRCRSRSQRRRPLQANGEPCSRRRAGCSEPGAPQTKGVPVQSGPALLHPPPVVPVPPPRDHSPGAGQWQRRGSRRQPRPHARPRPPGHFGNGNAELRPALVAMGTPETPRRAAEAEFAPHPRTGRRRRPRRAGGSGGARGPRGARGAALVHSQSLLPEPWGARGSPDVTLALPRASRSPCAPLTLLCQSPGGAPSLSVVLWICPRYLQCVPDPSHPGALWGPTSYPIPPMHPSLHGLLGSSCPSPPTPKPSMPAVLSSGETMGTGPPAPTRRPPQCR